MIFSSAPAYEGGAETDIIYQQGSVPSGFDGITWCNDAVSTLNCDQHYVRFRADSFGRALVCHESGHAVGLTHGDDASPPIPNDDPSLACMKTVAVEDILGTHNVRQIDGTYADS